MTDELEIKVPDIGGALQVDVIDILVKPGDTIQVDTSLVTLESDKASMDIPSPIAGVISRINLKIGDKVSAGDLILWVKKDQVDTAPPAEINTNVTPIGVTEPKVDVSSSSSAKQELVEVLIPDIGGVTQVDVIDVLIKPGMQVEKDQALVTLEGEKATMDIPSPYSGLVNEVKIKLGDKVAQGSIILTLQTTEVLVNSNVNELKGHPISVLEPSQLQTPHKLESPVTLKESSDPSMSLIRVGPSARRMAREFGVDLNLMQGSGRKSRITKDDIQAYIKKRMGEKANTSGLNLPASPVIDFTVFGDIESKPLNKIKKITGINVHRSWVTIPHVTQFDEADITDLEIFRKEEADKAQQAGYKLTLLAFICKAVSKALTVYPQFNTSLDATGEHLIYKKYCNIGIAVETPNGLVVPVLKGVNQLSVAEIAKEMARLSTKAREKGLMPGDMTGGCFTISSLGGIGGTAFTPIVNSPEVAILGLSRSTIKPVYLDNEFKPRLLLPLSLSYDHRVIDGAEAARFTRYLAECIGDIRKILL